MPNLIKKSVRNEAKEVVELLLNKKRKEEDSSENVLPG